MTNIEKFEKFLESLKRNESNDLLLESIKNGFKVYFEGITKSEYMRTFKQSEMENILNKKGYYLVSWIPWANPDPTMKYHEVIGTMVMVRNSVPKKRVELDPDGSIH